MGADNPKTGKPVTKNQTSFTLLLIGLALFLVGIVFYPKTDFEEGDKAPKLHPKEEEKLQKRLKEIDDAQQYALVAIENGWYPCNHPGRISFYLLAGEVWKYGVTTKGQLGRYSIKFLEKTNVYYVIQFQGTIAECMKEEQRKLFNYPYLPENLTRPLKDRLPRPPYNSKMQ